MLPGKPFKSPIRSGDDNPSFVVFASTKDLDRKEFEYVWMDKATGQAGTIFQLIKLLHPTIKSINQVYQLIASDFGLNGGKEIIAEKIVLYAAPPPVSIKIRPHSIPFTSKGRDYWDKLRINKEVNEIFHTTQIDYFWSYEFQLAPTGCYDPTFCYRVGGYYQIYSPSVAKKDKFRNDLPEGYFFGYLQLPPRGKKLIIDKSMKDVKVDYVMGYPAVAGKSETTMIPEKKMLELKDRFDEIYLTLDPDPTGIAQTENYVKKYPWLKPRFLTQAKDKSDLVLKLGFEQAETIINNLLT